MNYTTDEIKEHIGETFGTDISIEKFVEERENKKNVAIYKIYTYVNGHKYGTEVVEHLDADNTDVLERIEIAVDDIIRQIEQA